MPFVNQIEKKKKMKLILIFSECTVPGEKQDFANATSIPDPLADSHLLPKLKIHIKAI